MSERLQDVLTAIRICLENGLDWKETLIACLAIAAVVVTVFIIVHGVVKIVEKVMDAFGGIFDLISETIVAMVKGAKNLLTSAAGAAKTGGATNGPPKST